MSQACDYLNVGEFIVVRDAICFGLGSFHILVYCSHKNNEHEHISFCRLVYIYNSLERETHHQKRYRDGIMLSLVIIITTSTLIICPVGSILVFWLCLITTLTKRSSHSKVFALCLCQVVIMVTITSSILSSCQYLH